MISFSARIIFALTFLLIFASSHTIYAAEPSAAFTVEIADVGKSKELAAFLETKGIKATFPPANIRIVDEQTNCAVWIGKNVPLQRCRQLCPKRYAFYRISSFSTS